MPKDSATTADDTGATVLVEAGDSMQTLRARTVARGTIRQETHIRDLPPRPTSAREEGQSLSADDQAPDPMEDLLAALGTCLTRSIHANALAKNLPVRHVETTVEADMYRSGHWGSIGRSTPIGVETIKVFVRIDAAVPRDILADLVRTTSLFSPVANTLFNPIHLDIRLVDGEIDEKHL